MGNEPNQVRIHILEKEYLVACPDSQRDELMDSARVLDTTMREIRDSGKVIGAERIAVMAALNIAHELVQLQGEERTHDHAVAERLRRLEKKIASVLDRDRQMKL